MSSLVDGVELPASAFNKELIFTEQKISLVLTIAIISITLLYSVCSLTSTTAGNKKCCSCSCLTTSSVIELGQSNPNLGSFHWRQIARYLTFSTLLIHCLFSIQSTLDIYSILDDMLPIKELCNLTEVVWLVMYHLSKLLLYVILIAYWQHLYYGSNDFYRPLKYFAGLFVAVICIQFLYSLWFDVNYIHGVQINLNLHLAADNNDDVFQYCYIDLTEFPMFESVTVYVFDCVACVLILVLYWFPFYSVMKYGANSTSTFDSKTVVLVPKFAILVMFVVVSHFLTVPLAFKYDFLWLIMFDVLINSCCMLLMPAFTHCIYQKICFKCAQTAARIYGNGSEKNGIGSGYVIGYTNTNVNSDEDDDDYDFDMDGDLSRTGIRAVLKMMSDASESEVEVELP